MNAVKYNTHHKQSGFQHLAQGHSDMELLPVVAAIVVLNEKC